MYKHTLCVSVRQDVPLLGTCAGMGTWCGSAALSDVVLEVCGTRIAAHRVLLAAASPVFARMFESQMQESTTNVVRPLA